MRGRTFLFGQIAGRTASSAIAGVSALQWTALTQVNIGTPQDVLSDLHTKFIPWRLFEWWTIFL